MKSLKSLTILAVFIISAFVLTSSKCNSTCTEPSIVFDPSAITATLAPGELVDLSIVVTGDAENIESIVVSKSSNGVTNPAFMSVVGIGSKGKTVELMDSVPTGVAYGSVITYTVTATSDCKDAASSTKTYTITVGPSSKALDVNFDFYGNSTGPKIYSRFSLAGGNNSAWQLVKAPANGARFAADPNSEKDIRDSLNNPSGNPFTADARWGSRNGSKFVKAPSNFNYTSPSSKSIIDAYNAGIPSDLVTLAANDVIIVNIKNSNRYAAVKVVSITDTGLSSPEDFVQFSYWLAK